MQGTTILYEYPSEPRGRFGVPQAAIDSGFKIVRLDDKPAPDGQPGTAWDRLVKASENTQVPPGDDRRGCRDAGESHHRGAPRRTPPPSAALTRDHSRTRALRNRLTLPPRQIVTGVEPGDAFAHLPQALARREVAIGGVLRLRKAHARCCHRS